MKAICLSCLVLLLVLVSIPCFALEESPAASASPPADDAPPPERIVGDDPASSADKPSTALVAGQDELGEFEEEFGEKAAGTDTAKVFDPLQRYNRFMFNVNDKFYFWVLKPAAKGYNKVVPEFARKSLARAFHNFSFPVRFVSSLLQFKLKKTSTEVGRFVVNSTAGIGGLWDPAGKYFNWHTSDEDIGQLLGRWGVGDGFPIVLPVLGQTNLRDGLGRVGANWLNPVVYLADTPTTNYVIGSSERFNHASLRIGAYEIIKKDALDPYTFIRDVYKQKRDSEIKD